MAEKLGEAVLDLKTNDAAFMAGVNKAEAAANGLGKTLDACSGSSAKLASEITEAANSGNKGAQAWLAAGTAIQKLAAAQVEADVEIKNAKAALDAGTISLEQYKRQVLETQGALAIYEEEHRRAQTELRKSIAATKESTGASGAQRQGLIQLTQQLGDVSTMYALGARPAQIFASQIGQTAQAVQLMSGESSMLARFLGGPWGIGITAATLVLGPLIGTLIQTETEMKKVELSSNSLGDAQSVLGQMFDLATGKIKDQSEALRVNAEAKALNLRADASKLEASSAAVLSGAARGDFSKLGAIGMGLRFAGDGEVQQAQNRINTLQGWVRQYKDGTLTGSQVLKLSESMSFEGLSTTRQQFQQAIVDDFSARSNRKVADAIETSISSNKLDPMFLQPDKQKKDKKGKSQADIDAEFVQKIDDLNRDELQARLGLATDAGDRLEIQKQLLENDRDAKIAEIEHNKNFSAAQKEAMKVYIDRLYGRPSKVGANGQIITEGQPGLLDQAAMRQFEQEQTRLANDMLQRQAQTAQAWAQVSLSTKERARLEARALDLQQQIETNLLEQQIATGQVADPEKARAELRSQQEAARTGLAQRNAGPIDQYVTQLEANKQDSGRRVEALMVQELDYVHQSIADTISSRLGIKDPLLKGLIDMFLEDVLIRPLAEALQNARKGSGGGGGIFGSLFSGLFGGGGSLAGLVDSASATISDPAFAGLFADGGLIPDGAWGIVGDAGPEPIRATAGGIEVLPNSALRTAGGGGKAGILKVEISGARGNAEIQEMVRSGVAQGLAAYDSKVAGRVQDYNNRRGG